MTIIYGLVDPRTQQLRYVGKTSKGTTRRLQSHLYDSARTHKTNWINSLKKQGLSPEVFVIEEVSGDGCDSEIHHIAYFRGIGCALTNDTAGGDAPMLGKRHSAETKAIMSAAQKGRPSPLIGRKLGSETRARMSAAKKGKPLNFTPVHSPEAKAKKSQHMQRLWEESPERKVRQAIAFKERKAGTDFKERHLAAVKSRGPELRTNVKAALQATTKKRTAARFFAVLTRSVLGSTAK